MTTFSELPNEWIPLADGRRLAARIWLPDNSREEPVPAILEYLPYRKRDGTAPRDESTYPVFAANGYAGVRVDISGHGESDGIFDDEYSKQELSDGVEVIHWIAKQPWCSGKVGTMGISWGGFNALQLAALNPEPLKASIAIGTVVDRYHQDIHYKNGCQLYSNFAWANVMLCYASRPPDPLLRKDWRDIWLQRLKTQPWSLETWLEHQRRDDYWKHGSVCESYDSIKTPSLVISGWCDLYVDAPVMALENFSPVTKAINGPWIHKYPHFAWPKPRLDFHAEALAWWDRWLRGIDNGVEELPDYRLYRAQNTRATPTRLHEEGQWIAVDQWDGSATTNQVFFPGADRTLGGSVSRSTMTVSTPQDCGTACGEIFTLKPDGELPGDQRHDDGLSLTFDTDTLQDGIDITGAATLELDVSIDQPIGNIIARLVDVHPDGSSHRISWGVLNLCHRTGSENPRPMTPNTSESVVITLTQCGYRILPGHKLRLALSTTYWPTIMPPPYPVTATIDLENTRLNLPTCPDAQDCVVPEPENPDPLPHYTSISPPQSRRWVERDLQNQETHYHVQDDTGEDELPEHRLRTRHLRNERWSIAPNDPLTSRADGVHTFWMSRDEWSVRCECSTSLRCDATHYYLEATVRAFESDELVNVREWKTSIKRDFT